MWYFKPQHHVTGQMGQTQAGLSQLAALFQDQFQLHIKVTSLPLPLPLTAANQPP